jgi:hypothetical protein
VGVLFVGREVKVVENFLEEGVGLGGGARLVLLGRDTTRRVFPETR